MTSAYRLTSWLAPETTAATVSPGRTTPVARNAAVANAPGGLGDHAVDVEQVEHLLAQHAQVDLPQLDRMRAR
jgi:hypothetical protein